MYLQHCYENMDHWKHNYAVVSPELTTCHHYPASRTVNLLCRMNVTNSSLFLLGCILYIPVRIIASKLFFIRYYAVGIMFMAYFSDLSCYIWVLWLLQNHTLRFTSNLLEHGERQHLDHLFVQCSKAAWISNLR